ncbi:MAG: hypothetical protein U0003_03470 [Vampirovibrionales bacterium]
MTTALPLTLMGFRLPPLPTVWQGLRQSNTLKQWVAIEALVGSLLILAAPFLGDYLAPHYGVSSKMLAIAFAGAHYGFHVLGGAVLFKAGLDMGRLHHTH